MFFPLLVADDFNDGEQSLLQRVFHVIQRALNDHLVVSAEDFVFFEDH